MKPSANVTNTPHFDIQKESQILRVERIFPLKRRGTVVDSLCVVKEGHERDALRQ